MASSSRDLDPQQQNVYQWEDSWPGWNKNCIGINAARKLIFAACDEYKVKRPVVKVRHARAMSFSIPTQNYISLQGWAHERQGGLNVPTALHEAAHHIAYALHGERIQDHGRTWFSIYFRLLVLAKVAPEIALRASLRGFGIKFAPRRDGA